MYRKFLQERESDHRGRRRLDARDVLSLAWLVIREWPSPERGKLTSFPAGAFDDWVDALAQALNYIRPTRGATNALTGDFVADQ